MLVLVLFLFLAFAIDLICSIAVFCLVVVPPTLHPRYTDDIGSTHTSPRERENASAVRDHQQRNTRTQNASKDDQTKYDIVAERENKQKKAAAKLRTLVQ